MNIDKDRKGARSLKDLDKDVMDVLNSGAIASVNLTEWLAVDASLLVKHVLPEPYREACLSLLQESGKQSAMQSIKLIGAKLYKLIDANSDITLYDTLKVHVSDTVRCWASYILGSDEKLSVVDKLEEVRLFAADSHFGVREIAWMAVRDDLATHLDAVLPLLEQWAKDEDENVRRFATESIRPKGVWCKQIEVLKQSPEKALPILELLKNDKSKYVQDSVGNWLNDASKSRPDFVSSLCDRWLSESSDKATAYIVKKALRTIKK